MAYTDSYSKTVSGLKPEQFWLAWTDINKRLEWDYDTQWVKLDGPFQAGSCFHFKVKNGPEMTMKIIEATKNKSFTDLCKFFGTKLYGSHDIISKDNGELEIKTTIKITGPLAFLWKKWVGNGVVASLPKQTDLMIQCAQQIAIINND